MTLAHIDDHDYDPHPQLRTAEAERRPVVFAAGRPGEYLLEGDDAIHYTPRAA
jgi:hypothetical protein